MRAKFRCESVTEHAVGAHEVALEAVSDDNPENQQFNHATPAGGLKMWIDNPAAKVFFKPGKEYYLDFTEAVE